MGRQEKSRTCTRQARLNFQSLEESSKANPLRGRRSGLLLGGGSRRRGNRGMGGGMGRGGTATATSRCAARSGCFAARATARAASPAAVPLTAATLAVACSWQQVGSQHVGAQVVAQHVGAQQAGGAARAAGPNALAAMMRAASLRLASCASGRCTARGRSAAELEHKPSERSTGPEASLRAQQGAGAQQSRSTAGARAAGASPAAAVPAVAHSRTAAHRWPEHKLECSKEPRRAARSRSGAALGLTGARTAGSGPGQR